MLYNTNAIYYLQNGKQAEQKLVLIKHHISKFLY